MQVRFWGVRGSVPWATPGAIGHGCNTPCLELTDGDRTLILDAGSGIVGVGGALGGEPRELPIVLTHYHWDHLQGLPFLAQLYTPGWQPRIFAPKFETHDPGWMETIFRSPFFPVPADRLPNRPEIEIIGAGGLTIGGFEIQALPLNHPGGALAFRVRGATGDLVYATDHEFGNPAYDERLTDFARGAAALIVDAHFTPEEIDSYRGWGHSDWRTCAEFAAANGVRGLWLFHHKPGRSDEDLVAITAAARRVFPDTQAAAEREGLQI
ncbi:MAG TPA: MBL fold metallo-hydrolase [Vicinamibacterales bacterium]|nr:MBL fold metallo-hydrolase [Vicinamibacterales bacterium]